MLNFGTVLVFFSSIFLAVLAQGAPSSLTYQGRILKSDGTALEYNSVSFLFQITSPNGLCVVYEEQVNGIDMTNSGGVFDAPIGLGSRSFPASGSFTILDSLNNSSSLGCKGGSTYNPVVTDGRLLRVQFYDGSGWKVISPDNVIRSVPYAGYAASALKLGTNVVDDFVLKAGLPTCAASTFLSWDGSALSCAPVVGSSGGTVTNVTSANAYLTVVNGTSTPALTLNVGTSSNTVAAGNDSRFTDARTPTGTASGDLSGSYPGPTVAKIQGVDVSSSAPASGNFLKFNGTNWLGAALAVSDISGLSTTLGGLVQYSQIPTTCTSSQTLTFISPVGGFSCTNIQVTGASFAAQSAGTVLAGPTSGSAAPTFRALALSDLPSSITDATWNAASGNVYRASGNVGIGTTSPATNLEVAGALRLSSTTTDTFTTPVGSSVPTKINIPYYNPGAFGQIVSMGVPSTAPTTSRVISLFDARTVAHQPTLSVFSPNESQLVGLSFDGSNSSGYLKSSVDLVLNANSSDRITMTSTDTIITGAPSQNVQLGDTVIGSSSDYGSLLNITTASRVADGVGLTVKGALGADGRASVLIDTSETTNVRYPLRITANTGATEVLAATAAGNVGIGTTTPTTKLEVVGTIKATGFEGPLTATSSGTGAGSNSAPSYSFSADTDTGFYNASSNNTISVAAGGAKIFDFNSLGLVSPTTGGASVSTALGTASAPTFSFAGDTDTGWYRAAADTLAASTAGAERMRIDSSGRVGIGTTSPSAMLDVDGTVRFDSAGGHVMSFGVSDAFNIDAYGESTRIRTESSATNVIVTPLIVEGKPFGASPSLGMGTAISLANTTTTSTAREMASIGAVWTAFAEANHSADIFFSTVNAGSGPATASEVMRIKSDGKVGIGTTNPSEKLTVFGNILMNSGIGTLSTSSDDLELRATSTTAGAGDVRVELPVANNNRFGVRANSVELFTVRDTGNVGIGTTSPTSLLEINSTTTANGLISRSTAALGASSGGGVAVITPNVPTGADQRLGLQLFGAYSTGTTVAYGAAIGGWADSAWTTSNLSSYLTFETAGAASTRSERMRIDSNGSVGIGTTTPGAPLHIRSDNNGNDTNPLLVQNAGTGLGTAAGIFIDPNGNGVSRAASVRSRQSTAGNYANLEFWVAASAAPTEVMRITPAGNVGIGITTPSYKLDVTGDIRITGTPYRSGGDIAWQVPSDARLKDVTGPYEHGLNDLIQLDMIRFRYKDNNPIGADTSKEFIGVLAQDVQKVIPEAVTKDPKSGFLSLNTTPIFWALVNAVKDLKKEITELFSASEEQARTIASLKAENAILKKNDIAKDKKIKDLEQLDAEMKLRLDKIEKIINSRSDQKR